MAEEQTFKYTPGSQGKQAVDTSSSVAITWTASEYIDHKQGKTWFGLLVAATVGLSAIIYLVTKDYFGTAIILVLGLTVGVFANRKPRELKYELTGEGLRIEQKLYPFDLFRTFSVIKDGVLTSIDLSPIKRYMPPVSVYFDPADQDKILDVVQQHLPYEEKQLDSIERLTRRLRF